MTPHLYSRFHAESTWNLEYKWGVTICTHTKLQGKSHQGFHLRVPKHVFVTNTTRTFGHLRCTDFDRFWNRRRESVSACVHRWKIFEFMHREFYMSPNSWKWVLSRGVYDKARPTAQTAQFRSMGIVSVTRRHPKAVCFVSEFWWETYGLGAISP